MNIPGVYSPFTVAVLGNHYEIAELMCKRGAEMDVSGGKMYDNLFHQVVASEDIRFVKLMLEHGADIVSTKHNGAMTPLHVAATSCILSSILKL